MFLYLTAVSTLVIFHCDRRWVIKVIMVVLMVLVVLVAMMMMRRRMIMVMTTTVMIVIMTELNRLELDLYRNVSSG